MDTQRKDATRETASTNSPVTYENDAANTPARFSAIPPMTRINAKEEAMMADTTLQEEVEALTTELTAYCRALKNTRPPDDLMVRLLETAIANREPRTLRAAKAACDALPRKERRPFQEGWDLDGDPPSREEIRRESADGPVGIWLELNCSGYEDNEYGEPLGEDRFWFENQLTWALGWPASPVRVLVHGGTAKATVLAMLAKVMGGLAQDWDELVTFRPCPICGVPMRGRLPTEPWCPYPHEIVAASSVPASRRMVRRRA